MRLPRTIPLLTLSKCGLDAGGLLCWGLGVHDLPLARNGSLPLLCGKKQGFVSSQLDFSPTSAPWCFGPFTSSISATLECVTSLDFKHLLLRLGVDRENADFGNC